ncbi:MAG: replicative DNA helicase [Clostridia bacterium]|nr:replicative DNA helicase [Clostridia bacterium]
MDAPIGGSMPYSLEAEQAVLGSMILSADALTKAIETLRSDDFYLEQHKAIFDALSRLFAESKPVDIITLSEELGDRLEKVSGVSYLAQLTEIVSTTQNIKYYIDIISQKSVLRKLITAAGEISQMCYDEKNEVDKVLDSAEQKIFDILQNKGQREFHHIRDILPTNIRTLEKVRQQGGKITGLSTGYNRFDEMTAGLHKTDLIILAARTGIGKTSFALNLAKNVAEKSNEPVAVFSLEMAKEQLVDRLLWSAAKVDSSHLRTGNITAKEMQSIANAMGSLVKTPIYIDDTPGITVSEMRAKCRKLKLQNGLGMVVIDYLQLVQSSGRTDSRQQEIAEISRSLKIMAKDLNVPVLTLSQLSRASETRERPILSDLRESGAIEQDADIVLFLNRKNGDDLPPEEQNLAECIIAKHRNGSTGTIPLVWRGEYTTYMELEERHEP